MSRLPVVIANPRAGQKAGIATNAAGPDDLLATLERNGVEAELWPTEYANHATELARRAVDEGRGLVIAAGGDGTVTEVASGLVGSQTRLGILPLGSVMNLARMLAIPRDLDAAAQVIEAGQAVRIDAGQVTTAVGKRLFLEAGGAGVSAGLFAYVNQLDAQRWQAMLPMLRFLMRHQPHRVWVTIDGQTRRVRASMLTVANGPLLGAAFTLAPGARLDDRLFTVRVFTALNGRHLFRHVWAILSRRTEADADILTGHGRVVEIAARRPLMVHADSHPMGTTPARFELLPAALAVIVPQAPESEPALVSAGLSRSS
jgi:YegS/Rv2252/BmrU family lipid kinase